jgi:hypothetical protein
MKRLTILFASLLVACLLVSDLFATPLPPQMSLDKTGISISITWTEVSGADGYRLYYTPYPYTGPASIRSVDMGMQTLTSYTLWEDAAYYVSVTAYDGSAESYHSNTELFLLSSYSASSQAAPRLTLKTEAYDLFVSWSTVPSATNYRLYYAPYPFSDPKTIGSMNMGANTELSTTLWHGAAYYVAVTADSPSGESGYSNVELFLLGAPIPEWQNSGTPKQDNDNDGYLQSQGDCDDSDQMINPGVEEICGDEIDQNCDGVDSVCSDDLDLDGDGYSESLGDCNDEDSTVHPWAEEICGDGIDQDCSGDDLVCPDDADADIDGSSVNQGDCNDADQTVFPGAEDVCGDGIDQDCSGADLICPDDADVDNDGYSVNQGDCNDADQSVSPGVAEVCGDGIDQDCSGVDLACPVETDADGDGYLVSEGDCNDGNKNVHPNTWETCGDGIDQDCSGSDLYCPTGESSFESDLRTLINQYRSTNSLGALSHNLTLQGVALEHSDYMLQTGDFSHAGFTEIRAPKVFAAGCNSVVENLAWNFQTAQAAFNGWRNSSGHNTNMLNPDINYIGLSKSGAYITMLGCRIP